MKHRIAAGLLCVLAVAAAPAEPPATPPVSPPDPPRLIDPGRPAFVPAFAKIDNPPAGRFAEREYARRYTYPGPFLFSGYGGFGYGFGGGYSSGGYGYGRRSGYRGYGYAGPFAPLSH